jgi:regulator of RNase E activity RraB
MTPADARHANEAAIAVLVRAGADPEQLHDLTHTLSGDTDALELVRDRFVRDGFRMGGFSAGVLSLVQTAKLDPEVIGAASDRMVGYAKAAGLAYEGWRAMPVRRASWLDRLQRGLIERAPLVR